MMKRRHFGRICVRLLALFGAATLVSCAGYDPYQKVDYGEKILDRRLKDGTISQYEYDKAMKNYKPQTDLPPAADTSGNSTSAPAPVPVYNSPPPGWR